MKSIKVENIEQKPKKIVRILGTTDADYETTIDFTKSMLSQVTHIHIEGDATQYVRINLADFLDPVEKINIHTVYTVRVTSEPRVFDDQDVRRCHGPTISINSGAANAAEYSKPYVIGDEFIEFKLHVVPDIDTPSAPKFFIQDVYVKKQPWVSHYGTGHTTHGSISKPEHRMILKTKILDGFNATYPVYEAITTIKGVVYTPSVSSFFLLDLNEVKSYPFYGFVSTLESTGIGKYNIASIKTPQGFPLSYDDGTRALLLASQDFSSTIGSFYTLSFDGTAKIVKKEGNSSHLYWNNLTNSFFAVNEDTGLISTVPDFIIEGEEDYTPTTTSVPALVARSIGHYDSKLNSTHHGFILINNSLGQTYLYDTVKDKGFELPNIGSVSSGEDVRVQWLPESNQFVINTEYDTGDYRSYNSYKATIGELTSDNPSFTLISNSVPFVLDDVVIETGKNSLQKYITLSRGLDSPVVRGYYFTVNITDAHVCQDRVFFYDRLNPTLYEFLLPLT